MDIKVKLKKTEHGTIVQYKKRNELIAKIELINGKYRTHLAIHNGSSLSCDYSTFEKATDVCEKYIYSTYQYQNPKINYLL